MISASVLEILRNLLDEVGIQSHITIDHLFPHNRDVLILLDHIDEEDFQRLEEELQKMEGEA